jgi:DNA repair protein RadC
MSGQQDDTDFDPGADSVLYAPSEQLVDLNVTTLQANLRRRKAQRADVDWGEGAIKLFNGRDDLLVRAVLLRSDKYNSKSRKTFIRSVADVLKLCDHMRYLDQEHVVILAINHDRALLAIHESAIGTRSRAQFMVVDLIKVAILTGALGVFMIHNHPLGSATPSTADMSSTESMRDACRCVGLVLMDHIIIGERDHYSFAEAGRVSPPRRRRKR